MLSPRRASNACLFKWLHDTIERNYESGGRRFESVRARQLLSIECAFAFCRPFCKICFQDVLEFRDGAFGKLARPGQIFLQDVLCASQAVAGDGHDFWECATRFGKHRDRSATKVMEMKIDDAGGLARFFPLLGKVTFLESAACLRCEDDC